MKKPAAATAAVVVCIATGVAWLASTPIGTAAPAVNRAHESTGMKLTARTAGFNGTDLEARVSNLTPYTWTLAFKYAYPRNGVLTGMPDTVKPGQSFAVNLNAYDASSPFGFHHWGYSGVFTYRADGTVKHKAEYLSISIKGWYCTGVCPDSAGPPLNIQAENTTQAPTDSAPFDFGPIQTADPEITSIPSDRQGTWPNLSSPFVFTFVTQGDYSLDASKAPQLADLINLMCAGTADTTCSFTPTGRMTHGVGQLNFQGGGENLNCSEPPSRESGRGQAKRSRAGSSDQPPGPPADDPDWHEVRVTEARETSLSVGGSITASTEFKLLDLIATEVSLKFGVEHEWSNTREITKTVRIFLPSNTIGGVWLAPVVGKVTGTLVVATKLSSYTITDFAATKTGFSPDSKTPPFEMITTTRPLTMAEWQAERQQKCPASRLAAPPSPIQPTTATQRWIRLTKGAV